jgi:hypothetical protein
MTRLLVLAEGDSEELFVEKILSPHLQPSGVFARATCVVSKRFTGGNLWSNVRLSLQPLLADSDAWVTTLLDFYGLPDDFPGLSGLPSLPGSALDAVRHVEGALSVTMGRPVRFIPFIVLHEFEAWYFANPVKVAEFFGAPSVAETMEQASREAGGPENINQGKETHPSKRLERYGMGFRKTSAVALLQEIGIDAIRRACPHFNNWLTRLENLRISV